MSNTSVKALRAELLAASPQLVDNADLLRGVLAGCGDCIKVLDLDGRLQFMSEGGKRVMEVDDFSALKGCPWPDFWAGPGHADAIAAVQSAIAGKPARFRGAANTARGTPRYWDVQVSPIFDDAGKPSHLLSISKDITEERKAAELHETHLERQRFLTAELQHRVKNTLANVISIANQTFKGDEHREPRLAFNARLITLNRTHDILTASNWGDSPLREVLDAALAPHSFGEQRVGIDGPEVMLNPKQALAIGLAANELATNALKYGALFNQTGRVDITWSIAADGAFAFVWRESGGPDVATPVRVGFGSRVIRDLLANDFGGTVDLAYEPTGLICRLNARLEKSQTDNAAGSSDVVPANLSVIG